MEYDRAEAILLQALDRPNLEDRVDVLHRLVGLYEKLGNPEKQAAAAAQLLKDPQAESIQTGRVSIEPKPPPSKRSRTKRKRRGKRKRRR
jgi:hypothetical protein